MLPIAALLLAAAVDDTPGLFRHGQWRGVCFRDGTLRGQDDELCRADWTGNADLSLYRDADTLMLIVSPNGAYRRDCVTGVDWSEARATRRGRVPGLIRAIAAASRSLPARCHLPSRLPIDARDLAATLRETDGLTHISR